MTSSPSDLHHGDYERKACLAFVSITPVFIIIRFMSRILSKQLGSDDWAALTAWFFATSCTVMTLVEFHFGWGRHESSLTARQMQVCLILHYSFQMSYKIAVAFNKISLLLLYLRIMPQQLYRYAIFSLLTFCSLFAFATCMAGIFQCIPVQKAWNKKVHGHCYNLVDAWYSNAVFSIVTDFLILFLPMHMVYNLQRDVREKILLYAVFGLGIFVTCTSIMRFTALKAAKDSDTTYDIQSGFWSVIEINTGVVVICMPPLRALLARYIFRREKSTGSSSNPNRPYNGGYIPSDPSSHETGARTPVRKGRGDPEESEEELVYFTHEHSTLSKDNGIMKTTEIDITKRSGENYDPQIDRKPWERLQD